MGGSRQDVIGDIPVDAQKPKDVEGSGGQGGVLLQASSPDHLGSPDTSLDQLTPSQQKIRFHENAGEVHFHADDEKLKVAVPVAEWYRAWDALKNLRRNNWQHVDLKNGSQVVVRVGDINGQLDCTVEVTKVSSGTGPTFDALNKFTVPRS